MENNEIKRKPIGMMDSGLGGLSVYREMKKQLPREQVIYFGDTIHAPYGEKTDEQILHYVFAIVDFLVQQQVKMVIIACNTMTAVALKEVEKKCAIPVIGVIQPGAYEAVLRTKNKRIGIIGTEVTIRKQSYEKIIKGIDPLVETFSNPCSNQIIREMEEQALKNVSEIRLLLRECLRPILKHNDVDTLIWGCSHYPFLKKYIEGEIDRSISLVDPSKATVKQAWEWLKQRKLCNQFKNEPDSFYISGNPDLFRKTTEILLGYSPGQFQKAVI